MPEDSSQITKQTYAKLYLSVEQRNMAIAVLPDEVHPKEEWDGIWQRILNSPAL